MKIANKQLESFLKRFYGEKFEDFLLWASQPLRPVIRVNTLKANVEDVRSRLEKQGFILSPIEGLDFAFRVEYYPFEIGKTFEHYLGYIYVQELSSMLPAIALEVEKEDIVLDIASAPGSKTTLMSQLMENTGTIVANDVDVNRISALASNIDRLGCTNIIITRYHGRYFGRFMKETFNKVLVDVPCSAIGTVHKNKEVLSWWSWKNVRKLISVQKQLIESAFLSLRKGGTLVYSTCTIVPDENEYVVKFLLDKYADAEIVDFSLPVEAHKDSLGLGYMIPYGEAEPFYIAKIRKI